MKEKGGPSIVILCTDAILRSAHYQIKRLKRADKEKTLNVFVAGASGALGVPLVQELVKHGHRVTAMARSVEEAGSNDPVEHVRVNALDKPALTEALRRSSPEVVIGLLSSLSKNPAELFSAFPHDGNLRLEGGSNLHSAALEVGVKRYVQQSSGFYLKPEHSYLATEADSFQLDSSPGISSGSKMYQALEDRVFSDSRIEGIALRYGFFYGPGTSYCNDGGTADLLRQGALALVGEGCAVNSFIHVQDAALATLAALRAEPGVYNIVDNDRVPVAEWLPAFAQFVGAAAPSRISEEEAMRTMGADAVFYHNGLKGACNDKARKQLDIRPRRLEWLIPLRSSVHKS